MRALTSSAFASTRIVALRGEMFSADDRVDARDCARQRLDPIGHREGRVLVRDRQVAARKAERLQCLERVAQALGPDCQRVRRDGRHPVAFV